MVGGEGRRLEGEKATKSLTSRAFIKVRGQFFPTPGIYLLFVLQKFGTGLLHWQVCAAGL